MGIHEGNCAQMLYRFFERTYPMQTWPHRSRCPYSLDWDDPELMYKQFLTWMMYEWKNPATGTTVVAEFVAKEVRDPELAAKILQMQDLFFDTFEILEKHRGGIIVALAQKRRRTYRILTRSMSRADVGDIFEGRIHPWERDGTHMLCGIARLNLSSPAQMKRLLRVDPVEFERQFDDITIPKRFRASSVLLAYPEPFLGSVYKMLYGKPRNLLKRRAVRSIVAILTTERIRDVTESLSEDEMEVLSRMVRKGGLVGHKRLSDTYGGDDTYTGDWPRTSLGLLRTYGLVLVGRDESGRKVAAIASDVLAALKRHKCIRRS